MEISARLFRFVLIGAAAAATHFAVVWSLVAAASVAPLLANVIGWGVAFAVSFAGHFSWTFGDQQAPLARSARRFALVSFAGFAANELSYALLLRSGWLDYRVALILVLLAVAGLTYLLGRFWAFRGGG